LEKLIELVETTVDLDAADNHEYLIKPDFNNELQGISKLKRYKR
jgi:DNA mismatch repair ATPase MutS